MRGRCLSPWCSAKSLSPWCSALQPVQKNARAVQLGVHLPVQRWVQYIRKDRQMPNSKRQCTVQLAMLPAYGDRRKLEFKFARRNCLRSSGVRRAS
jgi:hypothetical protein